MAAIIASGSVTISPVAVSEYKSDQDGGTVMHPILGRAGSDATLRPAGMRTGSFVLDFRSEGLSESARASLSLAVVWTLTHPEQSSLNMRFIVRSVARDVAGDGRWPVTVQYEEIP